MTDVIQQGVTRQADALLHNSGGRQVFLRMPGMAASGDDAEQLGLATPTFQDISLGVVVVHRSNGATKLSVSASAVLAIVHTFAYDSADVLFEAAAGVLIDGVVYELAKSLRLESCGQPYCFELTMTTPK
jgi:hypothetical protein